MLALINKVKRQLKLTLPIDGAPHKLLKTIYNSAVFPLERRAWRRIQASGFTNAASLHMCSLIPIRTLDAVIGAYNPKTWLDAGCGTGASLEYILRRGISAAGLEFSDLAVIESGLEKYITQSDLTQAVDLKKVFDVVWCYEVAEHLPESSADQLVDTLVSHGRRVVFSAARPGQGGDGHINEQTKDYWQRKFESIGCTLDVETTSRINSLNELYSDNVICFYK
jgi:2-polyprenyl-3-methyl-5-hydroxy-6-metoxy-1,4-benzoquinol methylase